MTVRMRAPQLRGVVNVADGDVDRYLAAGWVKVEPEQKQPSKTVEARKQAAKKTTRRKSKE